MDKIRIIRQSTMDETIKNRVAEEVKGYFGDNDYNAVFKILNTYFATNELPPAMEMSRNAIKTTYETCAPLQGIISLISRNVGEVVKYLELIDRKTGEVVDKHEMIDLLRRPNDRFTLSKYAESWAVNRLLFDDAWQYVETTLGRNRKKQIYLIPSHLIEVVRGGTTAPMKGIKIIGAKPEMIPAKDVIESFGYNLDFSSFFGTSKVVATARYLSVIDKGMARQDSALVNGGVANIISPQKTDTGILKSDAQELEKRYNNKQNFGKTLTAPIAIDVHELGNKPVDLNILSSHKEAVTALCFVYNIPVDLYYGQAKYENAKEAKKTIYEQQAIPMAEEFANDILKHFDYDADFEFKVNTDKIDILHADPYDIIVKMNQSGAFTTNEIRETAGWERIDKPEMDEVRIPMNLNIGDDYDISEE